MLLGSLRPRTPKPLAYMGWRNMDHLISLRLGHASDAADDVLQEIGGSVQENKALRLGVLSS